MCDVTLRQAIVLPQTVGSYFASPGLIFLQAISTTGWQASCSAGSIV